MPSPVAVALIAFAQVTAAPQVARMPMGANPNGDAMAIVTIAMLNALRDANQDLRAALQSIEREKQRRAANSTRQRQGRSMAVPVRNPCDGSTFANWRDCVARVEARLPQMAAADRNALAPQIGGLRLAVQPAAEDDQAVNLAWLRARQALDTASHVVATRTAAATPPH